MYVHQCPTSPINNLPVELLSYIFSLSTHVGSNSTSYSPPTMTTDSVQVPLVLSSVNRLWRQVARGTPSLWSSICITVELVQTFYHPLESRYPSGHSMTTSRLDTSYITTYLALSQKYPLDILIDARDENWNFEPEMGGELSYTPPFTSDHMKTTFSLLLPHLSRWKSLSILTDCWAPMHTALNAVNPFITRFGAPLLQSLSLMRCNDLVSFSPRFQPPQLKEPAFLRRTHPDLEWCPDILPKLKYLSLRGVHVDWDTLGHSLSASETGLAWLELAWHSQDVRPSPNQFHKILSSSSYLRSLILSGSGPDVIEDAIPVVHRDYVPAHLPHLQNVSIGYRTALEGRVVLELLDAPNVRELTLEDATYAGDPEIVNAGTLLSHIGTRQTEAHQNHRLTSYELAENYGVQVATRIAEKTSCSSCSATSNFKTITTTTESTTTAAAFPLLESLTLRGVKTCSQPLRVFFAASSNLQHLELTRMSMQTIRTLLPSNHTTTDTITSITSTTPCPRLRSLCIRGFDQLDERDIDFIVGNLVNERQQKGACELREVDIHVSPEDARMMMMTTTCCGSPSMKVNIINEDEEGGDEEEEEEEDSSGYYGDEQRDVDPFAPGGAFNDPLFDAYYSSHFQVAR